MQTKPSWKYLLEEASLEPSAPKKKRGNPVGGIVAGTTVLAAVGALPFLSALATNHIMQKPVSETRDNQTILKASFEYNEKATIYVNNHPVPINRSEVSPWVDVSPFVQPGENIVRIEGDSGKSVRAFDVAISHAETRGKYSRVGEFTAPIVPKPTYDYKFNIPLAAAPGTLSASAEETAH